MLTGTEWDRPPTSAKASRFIQDPPAAVPAAATMPSMNRIPALWVVAYGSHTSRLRRFLARRTVHLAAFIRALALADHRPFTSL
ncbi:hypothetical protein S1361_01730 [Streptomyces cyanogenus]|uniref:Uncharacterized protein n=1 Tax=Streptomyces cyanogenus TaxID=80860 RepID=A0ABX7TKE1_STRCY|nr:hypothetical protein S1361_01730 [Streptomyces cyanogenus]